MDYDDNDFRSQNFQLVGEDNNKFPPNLRSFGLPKFDLDEHFQVHLRFDSLVDTDTLLDIHGQESNWIEDFSAGSAIEFSSSAAESCPISRHNNVWSEATSSESVEMLLKSVGEDEMLDKTATITETGSQEGFDGINNQIDPCSIQEDSFIVERGPIVMTDPALPPDKCHDSYLGLDVVEMGGQSQAVDVSQTTTDRSSEMHFDSTVVDKLDTDPSTVAEGCIVDGSLASSDDRTKQCVETKESSNENVLSEKPSDAVSMKVSLYDDHDLVEDKVASGSTDFKTFCSQVHPSVVSSCNPDMVAEKMNNAMFSERLIEECSAIALNGKLEVQLLGDAQEEKIQIDSEVNDQCSEDCPANLDLQNVIKSSCLEIQTDFPIEGCKNSTFGNRDGLLESIPYQLKVVGEICERDSWHAKQIKETSSSAVKCDDKFEGLSYESGSEDPDRRSHLTEGFKDTGHAEVESLAKDDGSQILNIVSIENTKMDDDYGQGTGFNSSIEETDEMQVQTENLISHVDSTSGSADKFHSSNHGHTEALVPKIKDDDCTGSDPSNFTSPKHESSHIEKFTEGEVGEKFDFTVNSSEIVVLEKSPSVVHGDVDSKISSSDSKSFDLCEANRLVGKTCSISVIPVVDSIQGRNMGPVASDSTHTNDDAFIALEKKADVSSACQNAATAPFVDEPLSKVIHAESGQRDVVSPSSEPNSVHSDKNELKAAVLNPISLGDSSSKTLIKDESFANAGRAELSCHESETDRSPSENTNVADMIIEQEEQTSSPPVPDIAEANEGKVKTSDITCLPVSESADKDERKAISLPRSESSMDICQDDSPTCFANKSPQPFTLSENNSNIPSLETGGNSPSSLQANGISPMVISYSEQPPGQTDCREDRREFLDMGGLVPSKIRADKIESTTRDSKDGAACLNEKSFTFEVGTLGKLSEGDTGGKGKPFSKIQSVDFPQVSREKSQGGHIEFDEGKHDDTISRKTKGKTTLISGCSTGRVNTSKRKHAKESSIQKQRDGNLCSKSPVSLGTISRDIQLEQMRQYPFESSSTAPCSPVVQASSLPDLNTSVSAAALFHQPFTDLQQVQLRAQIFVYGSLIQGSPPEETCMLSSFGDTDGGRNLWNAVWRSAVERFQNQKSPLNTCQTPINSHPGIWVPEQVRCSSVQNKALTPLSIRSGTKVTSAASSSTLPLPSPLWSISSRDGLHSNVSRGTHLDFSQVFSPVYSYQSSQARPYSGDGMPSLSQTAHPGPLVMPTQNSATDAVAQYSTVPITEPIHATPAKDSSVLCSPSMQLVSPSVLLPVSCSLSVSAASVGKMEVIKKAASPGNMKNACTAPKSRKKKVTVSESGPIMPASQSQADPPPVIGATKHLPVPTNMPLPSTSPIKVSSDGLPSATSHIVSPTHYQIIGSSGVEQRAVFSEETCNRIEQAKLQAEDAAALATASVKHSQGIWSQLAIQKKSGLVSEVEEKLASAAVAAAAAASVAKAAAAAAKVAYDAALQAKMMADEAVNSVRLGNSSNAYATFLDVGKNMSILTPISSKDNIHGSTSILSAAREAAKRRVEAASAATKRAENLDAIVKAAELAADAVSQAGVIIGMGDPLPFSLNELVEYGPEGYWKLHQSAAERHSKASNEHREEQMGLESLKDYDGSAKEVKELPSSSKDIQNTGGKVGNNELPVQSEENYTGNELSNVSSTAPNVHEGDRLASKPIGNIIQNGSLVEVVSDKDNTKGVWFSACVLDVKDGKAYVCYNDLRDGGSGQLKEWIPLDAEGNEAPRIRNVHPITAANSGGTRKRRRDVVSNYTWLVGDHVDAWIRDGWWEGIITEKNTSDETKLTVNFPVSGDSLTIRSWNLRPSLIWKDGQWTEWLRPRENSLHEGDTPQEKRQRVGRFEGNIETEVGERGTGKPSKDNEASKQLEEPRPLLLSAKDKIFSMGKTGRESNIDSLKVKRIGLQKEGSRVIFGIPRPGKKRKFMEVSKHYVADKTDKISEGNDSIKFAKYLIPQTSRMWRNTPKVDLKGGGAGESRPKDLKSATQNIQIRSVADKVNASIHVLSASNGGESGHVPLPSIKTSKNDESILVKKDLVEAGSFSNSLETADNSVVKSSAQPVSGIRSLKKKSSLVIGGELGVKRKNAPLMEKSSRSQGKGFENLGKAIPDVIEPRRSNRRIQPTSRLLEGLQSSLLISKIPSVSHDKGAKAMHRGGSSSRGKTHG